VVPDAAQSHHELAGGAAAIACRLPASAHWYRLPGGELLSSAEDPTIVAILEWDGALVAA
jgi:hypothetical protein